MHMSGQGWVLIRYQGSLYRIPKGPYETEERAHDRAWYVARRVAAGTALGPGLLCESHMWANEKYFGMKYK